MFVLYDLSVFESSSFVSGIVIVNISTEFLLWHELHDTLLTFVPCSNFATIPLTM